MTMAKRPWYKPTVMEILVLLALGALAISIALPSLHRLRETAGHQPCPSSLSQIGCAILLYSNENNGFCPPDLATLIPTQGQTEEVLHCPTSPGKPAYIYTASGQHLRDLDNNAVVCFEPKECHDGDGSNVLFGDGHVEFIPEREADEIRRQFDSGVRPITLRSQTPTSSPASRPI